jgi:hypothetical protein
VDPDSPEGHGIGASDRMQGYPSPIPGGRVHITNAESMRQQTPVPPSPPEVKDLNAHGVAPGTHSARERADGMRGPNDFRPLVPRYAKTERGPEPVPVYMVENISGPRILRTSAPHRITLQASTGEPVRLCGRDQTRTRIMVLNESTASNARIAQRGSDLVGGGGALLPWPANTYLSMVSQDELWAISADSGTPVVSIIQEFEQPW